MFKKYISNNYIVLILLIFILCQTSYAQSFDALWLRYNKLDIQKTEKYKSFFKDIQFLSVTSKYKKAIEYELELGLKGFFETTPIIKQGAHLPIINKGFVLGTSRHKYVRELVGDLKYLGKEGFIIRSINKNNTNCLLLAANDEKGLLYGVFHLLRILQTENSIKDIDIIEIPRNELRMVNHWDDPAGHVERGYAGKSIFNWDNMSALTQRDTTYVRLLASLGINASSINNVNTKTNRCIGWELLKTDRINDLVPFAEFLDSYGISMYLSVNFAAPVLIGGLETADPYSPQVIAWWEQKAAECFSKLPGFGGFLVKADSEGEPGPITYGRNHAEGANMLAKAVEPFQGLIIWRAFVYSLPGLSEDRSKHAFENFKPLDGEFNDNVIIQSKNGSVDFQVREPVAPLLGGLPSTNMTLELQVTQEYTGQATHVNFLIPQWKEVLDFDTYAAGKGSTVTNIVNGSVFKYKHSGIAGVWNFGDDYNWTGHYLAQANSFGFGRLAWNPNLSSESIARDWVKLTFGNDKEVVDIITEILLSSWKTFEDYTSPLGSGMLSDIHHYDPDMVKRAYVLNADSKMLGIDRTKSGSDYVGDYYEPITSCYNDINTIPDELLLFFHRVPYTHKLNSGKTVIQHIYDSHFEGVEKVEDFISQWKSLKSEIDTKRYKHVLGKFKEQLSHAKVWRDHINGYFYSLSKIDDEKGRLTKKTKTIFKDGKLR